MRDITPIGLRIPEELKARVKDASVANKRSMNSEMADRLASSFEVTVKELSSYSDGELISELMSRYERGDIYIRVGILPGPESEK